MPLISPWASCHKVVKMTHSVLYSHPLKGQYHLLIEVSNALLFLHILLLFFARCNIAEALLSCDLDFLPSQDVVICVWKLLMEPVIPADVHYQHISPRCWLWVISQGEVIWHTAALCLLTGALFRPACRCPLCSRQRRTAVSTRSLTQPDVPLHQSRQKTETGFILCSSAKINLD